MFSYKMLMIISPIDIVLATEVPNVYMLLCTAQAPVELEIFCSKLDPLSISSYCAISRSRFF